MARKPRIPSEPVEREQPAEPLREEEKLPWLQRVEDDEPPSRGGGKLVGYAVGAALLIIVLVAIGYAIVSRQHGLSPNQPEENLASLLPDQSLAGNGQTGNESAAAVSPAARHEPGRRREKAAESNKTSASSAQAAARAARHTTTKAAHEPRGNARAAAARASRADQKAPEPRRHEKKAPAPGPRAGHEPRRARSGPTDLLQLGAYDSRAAAERVWRGVSRSRPYAGAAHSVERARIHGRVYYRLRVAVPARTWQCVRLHRGRTPCMVVRWAP